MCHLNACFCENVYHIALAVSAHCNTDKNRRFMTTPDFGSYALFCFGKMTEILLSNILFQENGHYKPRAVDQIIFMQIVF